MIVLLLVSLPCLVTAASPTKYLPTLDGNIHYENNLEEGRFDLNAGLEVSDLTTYFFNALIVVSVLLLISNLLGITLFPSLTEMLRGAGQLIRDNIQVIRDKTGRSISEEELTRMANFLDHAVYAYDQL